MRTITLALCSLVFFGTAIAQTTSKNIPVAATAAFAKEHSKATDVKWDKEDGGYEASYKENGKSESIVFNAQGQKLETETSIKVNELPASVKQYIATHYKGKKIDEAARIVNTNGKVTYEAEVSGKDIIFDDRGIPIK